MKVKHLRKPSKNFYKWLDGEGYKKIHYANYYYNNFETDLILCEPDTGDKTFKCYREIPQYD